MERIFDHRPDTYFPGRHICSPNRSIFSGDVFHVRQADISFSRRVCLLTEQIKNILGRYLCSPNNYQCSQEAPFWLPNRYRFSRNVKQIDEFQEGTPLRTDISEVSLDGCFQNFITILHPFVQSFYDKRQTFPTTFSRPLLKIRPRK